jgi:hypothetical protein
VTRQFIAARVVLISCLNVWLFSGFPSGAASADLQAPLITLDYSGDRLQRLSEEPRLSIYDDGTVRLARVRSQDEEASMRLTREQVDDLLSYIRNRGFFSASLPDLAHSSNSALESHPATTTVMVNDGVTRTRSVVDYRHATGNEGFRAIVERLERLLDITRLGGYEVLDTWLVRANAELAAVHPSATPLQTADFISGTRRIDGSVNVVFARDQVKVSMALDAGGRYGVSVFPRP